MLIYISGAITGDSQYKAKFQKAKKELEAKGHSVINPAEFDLPEGATWEDYMKRDLAWLCGCDGIYMLKDWRQSRGAKLEHDLAQTLKMQVQYEPLIALSRKEWVYADVREEAEKVLEGDRK